MSNTSKVDIFISYSRKDKSSARDLFQRLENDGFDTWLDEEKILPGQDWDLEIKNALRKAEVVLLCLTHNSVAKEGYVQKELKLALDIAKEKPEGTIFIIPVRLEECQVPEALHKYQWVDLFENKGYERIRKALDARLDKLNDNPSPVDKHLVTNHQMAQVTILVERNILTFTNKEQESFVFAISKLTGVSSDQIRILKVVDGSVVVTLEMPEIGAKQLMELYYNDDPRLRDLKIKKITLKMDSENSEQATVNENRFNILFLTADPTDASRLRLGQEAREIREKLQLSKYRDQFIFNERWSVRPVDISQAMLDLQPQIVHFSGHGTSNGEICFENQAGKIHPVSPSALSALFEQFTNQIKVVVLNACYSELQANAIAKNVDYVIGMNKSITDIAAIAFSIGFYQAIGAGRTIADAYKFGVAQIRLEGIEEYQIPVLLKIRM